MTPAWIKFNDGKILAREAALMSKGQHCSCCRLLAAMSKWVGASRRVNVPIAWGPILAIAPKIAPPNAVLNAPR